MKDDQWFSTIDEEVYNSGPYVSKEEAIEKTPLELELVTGSEFFVGQCKIHVPIIDAGVIIEELMDYAHGDVGEVADDWGLDDDLDAVKYLGDQLNLVLATWLVKNKLVPTFGSMYNTSTHKYGEVVVEVKNLETEVST